MLVAQVGADVAGGIGSLDGGIGQGGWIVRRLGRLRLGRLLRLPTPGGLVGCQRPDNAVTGLVGSGVCGWERSHGEAKE